MPGVRRGEFAGVNPNRRDKVAMLETCKKHPAKTDASAQPE